VVFIGGLDEAGLGPVLGPYTAFLVEFHTQTIPEKPLYQLLTDSVSNDGSDPGKLWIADSKKIMGPSRDFSALEESILTVLQAGFGSIPKTFGDFMAMVNVPQNDQTALLEKPWYKELVDLSLPVKGDISLIINKVNRFKRDLEVVGIEQIKVSGRLVTEEEFNDLLNKNRSKAFACQEILSPLLRSLSASKGKLTIDRQGGRKFYGEWIVDLYPGRRIQIRGETPGLSLYRVDGIEIGFMVKADNSVLETALASLFAKYSRECAMHVFNTYWQKTTGDTIPPTAGYPLDGKRFIRALKESGFFPEEESSLIRSK
jgi:ribonuclease HII